MDLGSMCLAACIILLAVAIILPAVEERSAKRK
jgi:hypothetical protein